MFMAVVAKHGIWDNASFPWTNQTSAGLMGSIITEIDAWITAISGNASIIANGQVPVKKRDQNSSTDGGVNNGFVYEFPDTSIGLNNDGPTYPTLLIYGTETFLNLKMTDEYGDNTSNGGYGSAGQSTGHVVSETSSGAAGYNNEAIVVTETTDGEEFLAVCIKMSSVNSQNGAFLVAKDMDGRWFFDLKGTGFAYDNLMGYWTAAGGPYDTDPLGTVIATSNIYRPYIMGTSSLTGAVSRPGYNGEGQAYWIPKSPKIMTGRTTTSTFGEYRALANGTEQVLGLGYIAPAIIIPV